MRPHCAWRPRADPQQTAEPQDTVLLLSAHCGGCAVCQCAPSVSLSAPKSQPPVDLVHAAVRRNLRKSGGVFLVVQGKKRKRRSSVGAAVRLFLFFALRTPTPVAHHPCPRQFLRRLSRSRCETIRPETIRPMTRGPIRVTVRAQAPPHAERRAWPERRRAFSSESGHSRLHRVNLSPVSREDKARNLFVDCRRLKTRQSRGPLEQ